MIRGPTARPISYPAHAAREGRGEQQREHHEERLVQGAVRDQQADGEQQRVAGQQEEEQPALDEHHQQRAGQRIGVDQVLGVEPRGAECVHHGHQRRWRSRAAPYARWVEPVEIGVGPWVGPWPDDQRLDPELLRRRRPPQRGRPLPLLAARRDRRRPRHAPAPVPRRHRELAARLQHRLRRPHRQRVPGRRRCTSSAGGAGTAAAPWSPTGTSTSPPRRTSPTWSPGRTDAGLPLIGDRQPAGLGAARDLRAAARVRAAVRPGGPGPVRTRRAQAATPCCSIAQYGSTRSINAGVAAGDRHAHLDPPARRPLTDWGASLHSCVGTGCPTSRGVARGDPAPTGRVGRVGSGGWGVARDGRGVQRASGTRRAGGTGRRAARSASHTRRHWATSGPDVDGGSPAAARRRRVPPGGPVLVEQRGDGGLDPRRELAHAPRPSPARSGSPNRTVTWRRPGTASPGRAASRRTCRGARPARRARRAAWRGTPRPSGTGPIQPSGRAGALGEDHQDPAVGQHLARRRRHRAAAAVDREGVEDQRRADRAPPGVEEVVGRGRHGRTPPPLVGQRAAGSAGCPGARRGWPRRSPGPSSPVQHVEPLDRGCGPASGTAAPARPSGRPRGPPSPAGVRAHVGAGTPSARLGSTIRLGRARHQRAPSPAPARATVRRRRHDAARRHVPAECTAAHRTSASRCGGLCR